LLYEGIIFTVSTLSPTNLVSVKMKTQKDSYHHGALREALLTAAEKIVRREGVNALTLRAAARAAGVSHAAPAHHFKDLSGLLTELAIVGFRRFRGYFERAAADPERKPWYGARAYVLFATENPGLFMLMFRSENLDSSNRTLEEERAAAFLSLARGSGVGDAKPTFEELGKLTASWALVHGFAMLLLDGRLKRLLAQAPTGTQPLDLLDAAFSAAFARAASEKVGKG
jgi:AcrR family transcriptional regulator